MHDPPPRAGLSDVASLAHLAAIVESSEDAIISKNLDGIITSWNRAAQRIYGYTEAETVGQPITILIPEDRLNEETEILRKIRRGERIDHFETVRKRKDGTLIPVSLTVSPIKDPAGNIIGASKSARDITEHKRIEEKLRSLTQELDQRVAARTQELTVSQKRLRALATELSLAEERVRRQIAHELHDYLGQLLVVSRLKITQAMPRVSDDMTQQQLRDADRSLQDCISYTRSLVAELTPPVLREFGLVMGLTWLADQMEQHGLTVAVTIGAPSVALREDDSILLFQCVRELLMNVVKHAGASHAALVIALTPDHRLTITVTDRGRGFDPAAEQVASVEHFGLFSIRERMEAIGGALSITSAPGQGTSAMLTLPVEQPVSAVQAPPATLGAARDVPGTSGRSPVTILLVDDHPLVRQGLRGAVDDADNICVIGEAADGQEAVRFVQKWRPDIVVMDVNMPNMDGIEATKLIKQLYPEVAVIGLSVHSSEQVASAMKEAGAVSYLRKDVAPEELKRAIVTAKQASR